MTDAATGPNKLDDFTDHDDGIVWNASLVLLNHLKTRSKEDFKGKRVLEFGSGLGHLAWGLYKLGAHVTATDTPMGDLNSLRGRVTGWLKEDPGSRLTSTAAANPEEVGADLNSGTSSSVRPDEVSGADEANGGSIRVVELTWGESHWSESPLSKETGMKYDYIILAEVFSIPSVHEELLWSVQQFCHSEVVMWSIFMDRPFSMMFLVHVNDAGGFRVQQLDVTKDVDLMGMSMDDIAIYVHRYTFDATSVQPRGRT